MKVTIQSYQAVAVWRWDLGKATDSPKPEAHNHGGTSDDSDEEDEEEDDVCGICHSPYDGTCPDCKVPGDDCPLIWGQCTHVFHMHCLLKWIDTESSKQQCPMDRQEWKTAERS